MADELVERLRRKTRQQIECINGMWEGWQAVNPDGPEAADRIESLTNRVRELEEWQPIETAPKDGAEFLAYGEDLGWQVVGYDDSRGDDWVWAVADGATYHKDAFTHWQPLSEPARTALKGVGGE